jgi:hypothetical protein
MVGDREGFRGEGRVTRDLAAFRHEALRALSRAGAEASAASGPEDALWTITRTLPDVLGDREAHLKPGNLKEGEKQQFASGCFMVMPDRQTNILIAPVNFGPKQRHMRIAHDLGHPGHVIKTKQPMLLANTDEHRSFVKILETFRAGSPMFAPMMWQGEALGVLICAAQARHTMSEADLEVHVAFSHLAAAQWIAHGGPEWLRSSFEFGH